MDTSTKQMEALTDAVKDKRVIEPRTSNSSRAESAATPKKKRKIEGDNDVDEISVNEIVLVYLKVLVLC